MSNRLPPVVGNWYSHRDKGELFQIVALDESAGTIEIQEFDGGLDELDLEEWRTLAVETAAQPEDWSGPVDDRRAGRIRLHRSHGYRHGARRRGRRRRPGRKSSRTTTSTRTRYTT